MTRRRFYYAPPHWSRPPMIKHRRFYPLERRVFCPWAGAAEPIVGIFRLVFICLCELCRLPFGRMLYNRKKSGVPLRSYRPGGSR